MSEYGYHTNAGKVADKPDKRSCLMCGKLFDSLSIRNRRCPSCALKLENAERLTMMRTPLVYRTHTSGVRPTACRAEVGE